MTLTLIFLLGSWHVQSRACGCLPTTQAVYGGLLVGHRPMWQQEVDL